MLDDGIADTFPAGLAQPCARGDRADSVGAIKPAPALAGETDTVLDVAEMRELPCPVAMPAQAGFPLTVGTWPGAWERIVDGSEHG